jgi:hypothetical protein
MHVLAVLFFGFIASAWILYGSKVAYGDLRLPWVKDFAPLRDDECPPISIIFAARNEEEKLASALATLVAIDYPNLQIIAVDDRSTDATARILDEFDTRHLRLKAVHIKELPPGWLGKPHALLKGYDVSTGELIVFTDADVKFTADSLRRIVGLFRAQKLDHLALLGDVERSGFWDTVLISFFAMGFQFATDPYSVSNPNSRSYVGVGAFQMLRREAYEACGTHRRLAMEVVDDMKLGKIVKLARLRSAVAVATSFVSVAWHLGLDNLVRGTEKNFFAGAQFRISTAAQQILGLLVMNVLPLFGVIFGNGWMRALAAVALVAGMAFHFGVDLVMRISPLYCLTLPLGALIFSYMILRSTVVTVRQGGIVWRDTFYPLDELRRGLV